MRRVDQWLSEYGESHRHPINKRLHWICVPVIVWCVIALLWSVPTIGRWHEILNCGVLAAAAALAYYALLSVPLALGAMPILLAMIASLPLIEHSRFAPVWHAGAALFVLAWIGQFIGHQIEGKRPSFFKDIQFLLIGPLWLLADLYRRLGIRY
ncbi:MAG TPA: Mpo1-like protein [Steroidobacteraceae bacterium]|nr:Mpo1-like protein [Steroidobacteraceae bacterium]